MSHLLKKSVSLILTAVMFWLYGVGQLDAENWSEQMRNYSRQHWPAHSSSDRPRFAWARRTPISDTGRLQSLVAALRSGKSNPPADAPFPFSRVSGFNNYISQQAPKTGTRPALTQDKRQNRSEQVWAGGAGTAYGASGEPQDDVAPDALILASTAAVPHSSGVTQVYGANLGMMSPATTPLSLIMPASLTTNAMIASAGAGTFIAFGPNNYVRGTGSPVTVTDTFTVLNPATQYTLKAFNGGLTNDSTEMVSSSVVAVNGIQVIGPNNFNQNVTEVDVPVTLQSSNTVSVQVRGKPGGVLTIEIIGVDNDPPTISATASPAPDAYGWNNSNVVVTFTCSDKTSGVASCPAPVTVSNEGANQSVSGTAGDRAGNTASTSISISLDKTSPSIVSNPNPVPNPFGWNNTAVTVNFTCADLLSGIASCTPAATLSAEGANQVVSGSVTDRAGNTASTTATVSIDETAPSITASVSPSPNGAGWNNSAVNVNFSCADSLSGVAACPAATKVATEASNQTISGTATDKAGNSASVTATVSLDLTPPQLAITSPANNAIVSSSAVTVTGSVTDALSGVAGVICNNARASIQNGTFSCPVSLSSGANSIAVTATDVAGNSVSDSVNITYQQVPTGPFISSITPSGARFGDIVTISGGGFGVDRTQVTVRFSYDYGSGIYTVDAPAIGVADSNLTVAVPLAVPTKTNQVAVLVGMQTSLPMPYDVGALPADPTPNVAGNEAFVLVADMDQLLSRIDTRIDDWYVSTGTLTTTDTAQFHQVLTALRQALQTLQANAQNQDDQQTLHGLDILVSTQVMGIEHQKLLAATATLSGSPIGSRLCESVDLVSSLNDILDALDLLSAVLDKLLAAIVAACVVSVIIDIITLGTFSELSGLICGVGASVIVEFLRDFNQILKTAVQVARAVINPSPNQPVLGTYHVFISQFSEWPGKPGFVYVQGADPVAVHASNNFDNRQCRSSGCSIDLSFPIPVIEPPQSIPITVTVPYNVATGLGVDANLQFLPDANGQLGFTGTGPDASGFSYFTGADVNGPGLVRGTYSVVTSSKCGSQVLGSQTDSYLLISGPLLKSIAPAAAQLGNSFTICGDPATIPPNGAADSYVDFGDTHAPISGLSAPGCFPATVPDTALLTGPLSLIVNGRKADQTQPFTVLPPTLNTPSPDEVFATEPVVITGTGFAAVDANNSLTAGAVPVNVQTRKGNAITFTMGNATGGPLQLTAVGDHVSNQVPFKPVLTWSPAVKLSNPNRDAMNPVIAALADGRVGAAWIDRRPGGTDNLLFSDAKPGDPSFRTPITITTNLGGFASSPQRPGLAVGPNDHFYITWIDGSDQVHMSTFQFGTIPGGDVVVATAPTGLAFKESAVGVAPNGVVNVTVTEVPLNGDYHYVLADTISQDGGATFSALRSVDGPAPYLGEPDLTLSSGVLWRAYTKGVLSKLQAQISMFVQSSVDGQNWNSLGSASASAGIDQHPSVTGDSSGPIVAWDSTTYEETKIAAISTGTLGGSAALTPFFPNVSGSDGKRPTVAVDGTGIISVAWNNRRAGQSPDGVAGIPALIFNRFRTHNFSQPAGPNQNPSHVSDATTLESRPWMAVDGNRRLHLVWLSGPVGNRVLEYTNDAGYLYADTNAPDPTPTPVPARSLIAVSTDMGSTYQGTLLFDPDHPADTRWAGVGLLAAQDAFPSNMGPSLSPSGSTMLIESASNEIGTQLSDFGDDSTPFLNANGFTGISGGEFATWSPDGSVFASVGKQIPPTNVTLPKLYHSSAQQPNLLSIFNPLLLTSRSSDTNQTVSADALLLAYEQEQEATALSPITHTLRIVNLFTGQDAADIPDGYYPSWGTANDRVAFVQKKFDTNGNPTEFDLMEASLDGTSTPGLPQAFPPDKEIQWPVYSPDGMNVAFQIKNGTNWTIALASGAPFPVTAGLNDTRPAWSPDGQSLAFVRTDSTGTSQLMRWDLGAPAAKALTALSTGVVLGGAPVTCSSPFAQTNFFGQKPTFACTRGHLVWREVHE